jgi:hypothetical protein
VLKDIRDVCGRRILNPKIEEFANVTDRGLEVLRCVWNILLCHSENLMYSLPRVVRVWNICMVDPT